MSSSATAADKYGVPLISGELRHEEFVVRLCESLEQLKGISEDIFTRIQNRIDQKDSQLDQFTHRIQTAQHKVDQIRGVSKATRIFSLPKYPDDAVKITSQSLFSQTSPPLSTTLQNPFKQSPHEITSDTSKSSGHFSGTEASKPLKDVSIKQQYETVSIEKLLADKKQCYNFSAYPSTKDLPINQPMIGSQSMIGNQPRVGKLGRSSDDLKSVGSLLLFNTLHNLYSSQDDSTLDQSSQTHQRKRQHSLDGGPGEAPPSIQQLGGRMGRGVDDGLAYVPTMGEVPTMHLPDFLPELLGIADDISYHSDHTDASIAPSILNLPPILDNLLPPTPDNLPPSNKTISSTPPNTLPPPPPPPPPSTSVLPPPPPPPPPPTSPPSSKPQPPQASNPPPTLSDDRSSLMVAIRNAGGAGKAKLKKPVEEEGGARAGVGGGVKGGGGKGASGGDLMGDLAAKLQMRRKGITGPEKKDAGTPLEMIMDRIASIPMDVNTLDEDEDDWD